VSADVRVRRQATNPPANAAVKKAEKTMQTKQNPSRAAEDSLRLRVGSSILSLVILAALLAGTSPPV